MKGQSVMSDANLNNIADVVRNGAQPLAGASRDYDPLINLIADARFCLLGEATHGTEEFYRERAEITKRLIMEKGFTAVAVEADWPDAFRVNRYVRGVRAIATRASSTSARTRKPTAMRPPSA